MEFVMLQSFDNYIEAHIIKGRLEAQGIPCWLKDENISSLIVDPILTNTIGGIKLMIAEQDVEKATEVLSQSPENQ